jgi:predicted Zn-dependent protease
MYRGYNDTSYTLDAYTRVAGHEIGHVLGIDDAYEDLPIQ